MLNLNPLIKSHELLPESASTAFFKSVPAEDKPPATGLVEAPIPIYHVVEGTGGDPEGNSGGNSWRGGWASKFVPDSIVYETSMQLTENGLVSITHAPMGVNSVTTWSLKDAEDGKEGLVLLKTGKVTSNRALMTFIKTTIQGSYDKLAKDFVVELEKVAAAESKTLEAEKEEAIEGRVPEVENVN